MVSNICHMLCSDHALFFYVSRDLLLVLLPALVVSTKHQVQTVVHPPHNILQHMHILPFNSFTDLDFYGIL